MSATFRSVTLILLSLGIAWGQVSTGTITGYVHDVTNAVVPDATVSITRMATFEKRQVVTNDQGQFTVPYLPIGEYSVTVTMKGFKSETIPHIVLQVDNTVTLPIVIQAGEVTESVEVTAAAPLVDASTSSLGQVISNRNVINLPVNGRDVWSLGLLANNTVPIKGVSSNLPFIAGGGRFQTNNIMLDGIDNNTMATSGGIGVNGINYTPSVDATAEFKVITNNYSAEFSRSAGTVVSAATKSGTNELHGDLWEFIRNDQLDANNFCSNAAGAPRQPFKQNQFGFTLGGPVVLPKIYNGHGRTFLFVEYEGLRRATAASSTIDDIPPEAFRTGDFSSYPYTIYDPGSRQIGPNGLVISSPFPGNVMPTYQQQRRSGHACAASRAKLWSSRLPSQQLFEHCQASRLTATNTISGLTARSQTRTRCMGGFRARCSRASLRAISADSWVAEQTISTTQLTRY